MLFKKKKKSFVSSLKSFPKRSSILSRTVNERLRLLGYYYSHYFARAHTPPTSLSREREREREKRIFFLPKRIPLLFFFFFFVCLSRLGFIRVEYIDTLNNTQSF